MTNCKTAKVVFLLLFVLAFLWTTNPSQSIAQPLTHTVVKGDTLWDLCAKYYGDPNLWPKLWEMNPFITNPHLLKPGDVITLFELKAVKKPKVAAKKVPKPAKPSAVIKGVDISNMTNLKTLGYLTPFNLKPWGHIRFSGTSKLFLAKGDTIFADFGPRSDITPGMTFSIARPSELLTHPLTGADLGYIIAIEGSLVVKERIKRSLYKAKITESFSDVHVGDLVVPHETVSPCIQPVSTAKKLYGNIVAAKNQAQVIGQYSIVYVDSGFEDGIKRDYIFEAVRTKKVPSFETKGKTLKEIMAAIIKDLPKRQYLAEIWTQLRKKKVIYEIPIGKLMIVETRPHTSTAIVLSSSRDLWTGAFIRGTSWLETPSYLSKMPVCKVQ